MALQIPLINKRAVQRRARNNASVRPGVSTVPCPSLARGKGEPGGACCRVLSGGAVGPPGPSELSVHPSAGGDYVAPIASTITVIQPRNPVAVLWAIQTRCPAIGPAS